MKLAYLFAWCWFIGALVTGCTTTYYPSGRKSAVIGSNVANFALHDGAYSVEMDQVDNAVIHNAVGNTTTKTGASAVTLLLGGAVR